MLVVTKGYTRLQRVTESYTWLQKVTGGRDREGGVEGCTVEQRDGNI